MKKGFVFNDNPSLIPANHDFVYFVGLNGKERDPLFLDRWKNENSLKRGVIHKPALSQSVNEYDNASAMKWLLDDLGYSNWNNGVPVIVDIFGASGDSRFNLDHIRVYGSYNFEAKTKFLLRLNVSTWNSLLNSNKVEALRLLNYYNILLVQWGVQKPAALAEIGMPLWWEYENGKIAFDETAQWLNSPVPPVVVKPPVEEPPVVEPPVEEPIEEPVEDTTEPIEEEFIPIKFKIKIFGITIGEIEQVLD
jgi:hypothetical protein